MKVNDNKELDNLVDKMMKGARLESPSIDFTSKIMTQVLIKKNSKVTEYKPLISKTTFAIIFGMLLVIYYILYNHGEGQSNTWFSTIDFSTLYKNKFLQGFNPSRIMIYSVVAAASMFYIQIYYLKNHINKRFDL
jgi:hypothetical protein